MNVDITRYATDPDSLIAFSASKAETGNPDIGRATWRAALVEAAAHPMVSGADDLVELIDWLGEFGAWTMGDLETWPPTKLNALLLQFVAGDLREWFEGGADLGCQVDSSCRVSEPENDGQWEYYVGI